MENNHLTCDSCRYAKEIRMPGQIQQVKVCTKNPPVVIMLQGSQGAQLVGMQPPIPSSNTCGEHRHIVQ